jgi:hypothetical protein
MAQNAINLSFSFFNDASDDFIKQNLYILRFLNVKYVLCSIGAIRKDGTLAHTRADFTRWKYNALNIYPEIIFLGYFVGNNLSIIFEDESVQTTFVNGSKSIMNEFPQLDGLTFELNPNPSVIIYNSLLSKIKIEMQDKLITIISKFNLDQSYIKSLSSNVDIFFPKFYDSNLNSVQLFYQEIASSTNSWLSNTDKLVIPFIPFFHQTGVHYPSIENIDTVYNSMRNMMNLSKQSFAGLGIIEFLQFYVQDYYYLIEKPIYISKLYDYVPCFFNDKTIDDFDVTNTGLSSSTVTASINASLNGSKVRLFPNNKNINVTYTDGNTYSIIRNGSFSFNVNVLSANLTTLFTIEIINDTGIHFIDNVSFHILVFIPV